MAEQLNVRKTADIIPLHLINDEVPEYLSAIIARAMSFTPSDRFQSAEEMLEVNLVASVAGNLVKGAFSNTRPFASTRVHPPPPSGRVHVTPSGISRAKAANMKSRRA